MGTIAEKLTYLDGTKQALKESINNIGGDITSETTFREYAQELDNIYDNLPKTTGESSSLSLNTLKGKMNITPKGDTSQDGTPTPSTPIDIEVVTGEQDVKVENKNIFDKNSFVRRDDYSKNDSGTEITLNGFGYNTNYIAVQPNTQYHIFGDIINSTSACRVFYYDNSKNWISRTGSMGAGVSSFSFTTPNNCYYIQFQYSTNTINVNTIQIELGSTATPYTPHQEQTQIVSLGDIELCKIGNYQDYLYKSNDKWYKKGNVLKYDKNTLKNLVWNVTANGDYKAFWTQNNNLYVVGQKYSNLFSYENKSFREATDNKICENANTQAILLLFNTNVANTIDEWKTWLQSNNLVVYLMRKTPQDIEITNETLIEQLDNLEKLKSYNGITNINCSGNLSAILGVSALKGE